MREVAETFPASLCRMQWIAYFNDSQRQASMDAGTIAGLNVMRIIKEPADAAMAYGFGMETNYNGENSLLIIDLGGGIFIEELIVEVRGTTGDCHLFPATYVPPLRGGCGARPSRMSRRTRQRENPLVTERYLTAEPHGSSEQVSCPPSRL